MPTYYEVRVTDGVNPYHALLGRYVTMQQASDAIKVFETDYKAECPQLTYYVKVIAPVALGGTLACLAPILVGAYKYAAMVEGLTREGLGRMPDLPPKSGYTCVYPRDDT